MESNLYNNLSYIFSCICNQSINCLYAVCCYCFKNKYKCEICDTRYTSKHDLAYHIRDTHSEIYVWGSSKKLKEILDTEKLI